jgi:hypothetical protein
VDCKLANRQIAKEDCDGPARQLKLGSIWRVEYYFCYIFDRMLTSGRMLLYVLQIGDLYPLISSKIPQPADRGIRFYAIIACAVLFYVTFVTFDS